MEFLADKIEIFAQLSSFAVAGGAIVALRLYVWTVEECRKVEHKQPVLTALFWTPVFAVCLLAILQFIVELVRHTWFSI